MATQLTQEGKGEELVRSAGLASLARKGEAAEGRGQRGRHPPTMLLCGLLAPPAWPHPVGAFYPWSQLGQVAVTDPSAAGAAPVWSVKVPAPEMSFPSTVRDEIASPLASHCMVP
jgi:hypothetical protein